MRQYPDLSIGDKVKILTKKSLKFKKQRHSVWSENEYEIHNIIESMGQRVYEILGQPKKYLRHELLLMKT